MKRATHHSTRAQTKYPSPKVNMNIVSSSSIADRAKLRSRNTKPLAAAIDTIELSSDDDDLNLLPIPQTGKLASKTSRQKKSRSEDHPAPNPRPRPRPRPILKSKDSVKATHHTPSLLVPTCQRTTPVPASSSPPEENLPIPFRLLPLLSDPPSSTSNPYDHPPIATLPNLDTELDVTSSPPSSLFSMSSPRRQKPMRKTPPVDELDPDDDELVDRRRMPPPAASRTFFASSSSPPTDLNIRNTSSSCKEGEKHVPTKKATDKKGRKDTSQAPITSEKQPKPRKGAQNKPGVVRKGVSNANGKGKGKEVFKSREFIEEDDDGVETGLETTATRARAGSITSLSSLPDSDPQDAGKAGSSKKRKSLDEHQPPAQTDEQDPQPRKRTNTRRRIEQTILSEEEGEVDMRNINPSVSRKDTTAEANKKGQGKQANVAQEQEDHGVTPCAEEMVDHTISKVRDVRTTFNI